MKKVLMIASKANMIQQFNHHNIRILQKLGYEVHVATNMIDFGSMSDEENDRFKKWMIEHRVCAHQVDFGRRMGTLFGNIKSIRQLSLIFKENDFLFVHVHSPLGSIIGRLVAKKFNVPVVYTAHGFHFFKGGPKRSWLIFYPLEWFFSFITDTLITINNEDYELAKKHMHSRQVIKINGVGVDVKGQWEVKEEVKKRAYKEFRKELNIPNDAFLISSVGELSDRKNHQIVLNALKLIPSKERMNIYYVIAGTGNKGDMLQNLSKTFGFDKHFFLLGYRLDIHDINYASNIFIFPSLREGLGIAGLDATVDGTFVLGTKNSGMSDYIHNGVNGELFSPDSPEELSQLIQHYLAEKPIKNNKYDFLESFDYNNVDEIMFNTYRSIGNE